MPPFRENETGPGPSEACLRFDADLAAYLEGESRPAVSAHAADCAFCAAVLADLGVIRSAAGEFDAVEPPAILWIGVRAALVREGLIRPGYPSEACLRFDAALADYLEGDSRSEVSAHAAECAFCGTLLADLELIRSAAEALETAAEPPERLWAKVRKGLLAEGTIRARRRRWAWPAWVLQPMPAAALAGLVLVGCLSLGRWFNSSGAPVSPSVISMAVDPGVQESVQEMEGVFRARTSSLDPVITAALRKDLDSLDSEIRECVASLKSRPGDGLARDYLAAAYTEKAQILASALDLGNH